jgi:hypothetical protein
MSHVVRILDIFLEKQMQMDLIGSKIVMLVLIVLKASKNETKHLF